MIQFFVGTAALALFVRMLISGSRMGPASAVQDNQFIDPDDARQIGLLAGLAGQSIPDAATMRFALRRFESQYGRRATTRDIGTVFGLVQSID